MSRTEQQAVLQTAFYLLDTLAGEGLSQTCPDGRTIEADETVQALCSAFYMEPADDWHSELALRLASVSSASAEGFVLVPRVPTEAMVGAGRRDGSISEGGYRTGSQKAKDCWASMIAASPEPVPATNQAGKWRERWYGSEPQKGSAIVDERGNLIAYFGGDQATHKATTAAVAAHNAALATQPATSQEGEACDPEGPCTDCDDTGMAFQTERPCSCGAGEQFRSTDDKAKNAAVEAVARAMCDRVNGIGDYDANIQQRRTGWMKQAEAGIAAYLAATPTPPTLSEDLREWHCPELRDLFNDAERLRNHALGDARWLELMRGVLDMLKAADVELACDDAAIDAALARAQVKAS